AAPGHRPVVGAGGQMAVIGMFVTVPVIMFVTVIVIVMIAVAAAVTQQIGQAMAEQHEADSSHYRSAQKLQPGVEALGQDIIRDEQRNKAEHKPPDRMSYRRDD